MDFDEYDYLEKTVENLDSPKMNEIDKDVQETPKNEEKVQSYNSKHKNDVKGDDSDHRSKRSKTRDVFHDRDYERGSSVYQLSRRDGERTDRDQHKSSRERRNKKQHWDQEERNGRDRDRERDRGRDKMRERDRDKDKKRVRNHDREKDGEQEQSHRSRSHSERHRDERDREKGRDIEHKERESEKEFRKQDQDDRQHKDKKEEVAEPEVDPERDQRTVFAYQISLKADERHVYEFFSRAGKVRDVRLIMDRNSRRSKGVGYVEFFDAMSVPMAIALSGQPLLGQPVMVKPSEAEKNLVQSTSSATGAANGAIGPYSGGARRLYVGNLHLNMKEDQLRQVFEPFGTVELVQLPTEPETGNCKGFGFIQFARLEDARAAQSLDGQLEIAGRFIKVSAVTDQTGQEVEPNTGDFDDEEGGGLALNARSRALLMQKLDRGGTASSVTGSLPAKPILGAAPAVPPLVSPLVQVPIPALSGLPGAGLSAPLVTVPSIDLIGVPSECLLLKNMFDPKIETEPYFELDIKEDVQDECSKFGMLKHIYVDKDSLGFVYLRFEDAQSAMSAQRALHGRWFAGKMITATFMVPQNYEAKFPESK